MKTIRIMAIAVLIVGSGLALLVARDSRQAGIRAHRSVPPRPWPGARPSVPLRETVTVAADKPIPNLPGKRLVTHIVDDCPGVSLGPAPSRGLGFRLRLRPLGRGPEPGR